MLVLQYLSILALVFVVSLAWHDGPAIGAGYAERTGSKTDEDSSTESPC
jgi:hypothetical protein